MLATGRVHSRQGGAERIEHMHLGMVQGTIGDAGIVGFSDEASKGIGDGGGVAILFSCELEGMKGPISKSAATVYLQRR